MQLLDHIVINHFWFFPLLFTILGACIGSFLNVVIYRLPKELSLSKPPSRCSDCLKPIPFYHNIPCISWLILRGKCMCSEKPIPARYFIVELLTALLFLTTYFVYFPSLIQSSIYCIFISLMICCIYIDLDTLTLPDQITINATGISLLLLVIAFFILPVEIGTDILVHGLMGLFVGSGVILWLALFSEVILKKETMGFGDVKLMGLIGLYIGWQGAVLTIFFGAVISLLLLSLFKLTKHKASYVDQEHTETGQFPFGPGLALAAILYTLYPIIIIQ